MDKTLLTCLQKLLRQRNTCVRVNGRLQAYANELGVGRRVGDALYFSRSPIPYDRDGAKAEQLKLHHAAYRHLGLYAYRVGLLQEYVRWEMGTLEKLESLEQLRILENGHRIAIAVAEVNLPPGVDTQEDLDRLNLLPVESFQ